MAYKITHTVRRGRSYYYNRRVPQKVAASFGCDVVRVNLGTDEDHATRLANALTVRLDELWEATRVVPVPVSQLLKSLEPRSMDLLSCTELYLKERDISEKPVWLAVTTLIAVAGNKDVSTYTRAEARVMVEALLGKGNKTATVRRRIQSLHAVLEFGFLEKDEDRRNPFARLTIPGEGKDSFKRGVFSNEQLADLYREALVSGRDTWLVLPILGETGARLAEVVGLRWQDVCFSQEKILITPYSLRRLKTPGSEREVPLVGSALDALKLLKRNGRDTCYVFPRWVMEGGVKATHASNALNKHLRSRVEGLTCHCYRHTMRDRLRNSGFSGELIDQIGGWSSSLGVGAKYGLGYNNNRVREALEAVQVKLDW